MNYRLVSLAQCQLHTSTRRDLWKGHFALHFEFVALWPFRSLIVSTKFWPLGIRHHSFYYVAYRRTLMVWNQKGVTFSWTLLVLAWRRTFNHPVCWVCLHLSWVEERMIGWIILEIMKITKIEKLDDSKFLWKSLTIKFANWNSKLVKLMS